MKEYPERTNPLLKVMAGAAAVALAAAACTSSSPSGSSTPIGAGGSTSVSSAAAGGSSAPASGATGSITVGMVGNPQMKELEQLKGEFESSHPGITVNLLILPENEIRSK